MNKTHAFVFALSLFLLCSVSSCHKNQQTFKVQFLDAATNCGYVDFYMQGSKRSSLISYGTGSNTHTADIQSGDPLLIEIKNATTNATIASGSYSNLSTANHYSFIMYGDVAHPKTTLLSDTIAWPAPGKFKLRFSNFSADAPALDMFCNNDTIAFNKLYYGTDSTQAVGNFVELAAGTYTITVKDHNTGQTLILQPNIGIQDNRMLEYFAAGLISDSLVNFFRLGGMAR